MPDSTTLDHTATPPRSSSGLEPSSKEALDAQAKRELLRERIEAGEQRNRDRSLGDYARDTVDSVTGFAKAHPVATVAGAIGLGLAIGALTRPGRRVARQGVAKTSALAALASEAVLAFGAGLIDEIGGLGRSAGDAAGDAGARIGHTARRARRDAAYKAGLLADDIVATERAAARGARRGLRNLRHRFER